MKMELPLLITGISGIVYVLSTYFAAPVFGTIKNELDGWFLLVFAVAYAIGIVNLSRVHIEKIQRKRTGWGYSVLLLICMVAMLLIGLYETNNGTHFQWLFNNGIVPAGSTMYSILVFYISSAAYRAFRARSGEAAILLIAAVIVMLGVAPIGEAIWKGFPPIYQWIMKIPNTAGMRGITIGATLGGVATALRILLGIERAHLGAGGE